MRIFPKHNITKFFAGFKGRTILAALTTISLLLFCIQNSSAATCPYPLSSKDLPGITCSIPTCASLPSTSLKIPRITCTLPECSPSGATNAGADVAYTTSGSNGATAPTCTYKQCSNPKLTTEIVEGRDATVANANCSLRLCSQPLADNDIPGETCTIRKCGYSTKETPGLDCMLPDCNGGLVSTTQENPGVNCVYRSPVTGKLVPVCDGTPDLRNHKVNCMDMSDLPLCTSLGSAITPNPGGNCINKCSGLTTDKAGINCYLPSCDALGNDTTKTPPVPIVANPGVNCLFSINGKTLPLCKNNSNILIKNRRVNCADIIDLPLCTSMGFVGYDCDAITPKLNAADLALCKSIIVAPLPGKNCVPLCPKSTAISTKSAYTHNVDCIRFCPAIIKAATTNPVAAEVTSDSSNDCVKPLCHQIPLTYTNLDVSYNLPDQPNPTGTAANCNQMSCDLLTPQELNDSKYGGTFAPDPANPSRRINTTYPYCDGSTKCYNFKLDQLMFVSSRPTNTMCDMNRCMPDRSVCSLFDDTLNISNQGTTFTNAYRKQFYGNLELKTPLTCKPLSCKPIVKRYFRCEPQTDSSPTTANANCDPQGSGHTCSNSYCYQTVDCNNWLFTDAPECAMVVDSNGTTTTGITDDVTAAWFFRPTPMDQAYKQYVHNMNDKAHGIEPVNNVAGDFRQMTITRQPNSSLVSNICYSIGDMHAQGEVRDINLFGNSSALYNGSGNWGANVYMDIPLGFYTIHIPWGYFHSSVQPDHTRSPGMCVESSGSNMATKIGGRGVTIEYICGNQGAFWNRVARETAYFSGYVKTAFREKDATHSVRVCLRFKNVMRPDDIAGKSGETCGARECGINCGFGLCLSQTCGSDVCRELSMTDTKPAYCMASGGIMGSSGENDCVQNIGTQLRLRAVKYGRYICAFVDAKGPPAFNGIFFNGEEKLFDGTPNARCISGSSSLPDSSKACHGYDTNDQPANNFMWRTSVMVPYIGNNRPNTDSVRGYLDFDGRLFREQECMRVPLRSPPPRHYNLGNALNSYKMFAPPLYILNVKVRKGGTVASPTKDSLGKTDFHYPEIVVQFGSTQTALSLDMGQTGYEDPLPSGSFTTINSQTNPPFDVEVLVRKEFDESSGEPLFCLYRRVKDENGTYIAPAIVECVSRQLPEINGNDITLVDSRRVYASAAAGNVFTGAKIDSSIAKIDIQLLAGPKKSYDTTASTCSTARNTCISKCSSNVTCINSCYAVEKACVNNCDANGSNTGTFCKAPLELENVDADTPTCSLDLERYQICVQRDPCTLVNYECTQNEIDLHKAKVDGTTTASLLAYSKFCSNTIIPSCNRKFGINSSQELSIFNYADFTKNPLAYGWFNEICIVKGFETKLRTIVAKTLPNGTMGKCNIDTAASPRMQPGKGGCDDGGLAPGCKCAAFTDGMTLRADEVARKETPHEAGLCVEIPKAPTCAPINYNILPNTDNTDPDYIRFSYGKDNCNTTGSISTNCSSVAQKYCGDTGADPTNCVHESFKYRTNNTDPSNTAKTFPITGHAEFSAAVVGMEGVEGECKGFWRNPKGVNGIAALPKASCLLDSTGKPVWKNGINSCIRHSCDPVTISPIGIKDDGTYTTGFALASESNSDMGLSQGFATWPEFTKTTDFPQSVTASACIPGFRPAGSSLALDTANYNAFVLANPTLKNTIDAETSTTSKPFSSLFRLISANTTGTGSHLPTRYCYKLGSYSSVDKNTQCIRKSCPAINPPTPKDSSDTVAFALWTKSGGASFPSVPASRSITSCNDSTTVCESSSISTGSCNTTLGFAQSPGAPPPSMMCDSNGNWSSVSWPCVTGCPAISTLAKASTLSNGFAYWDAGKPNTDGVSRCVEGYRPNPYPPATDKYGAALSDTVANDLTRPLSDTPIRVCITDPAKGNSWGAVSAPCINKCPGYDIDPRVGVGLTVGYLFTPGDDASHTSYFTIPNHIGSFQRVDLKWPSTEFGQWAEIRSPTTGQSSADYKDPGTSPTPVGDYKWRANNSYVVRRRCNPDTHKWDDHVNSCLIDSTTPLISSNRLELKAVSLSPLTPTKAIDTGTQITSVCSTGYKAAPEGAPIVTCTQSTAETKLSDNIHPSAVISPGELYYQYSRNVAPYYNITDLTSTADAWDGTRVLEPNLAAPYPYITIDSLTRGSNGSNYYSWSLHQNEYPITMSDPYGGDITPPQLSNRLIDMYVEYTGATTLVNRIAKPNFRRRIKFSSTIKPLNQTYLSTPELTISGMSSTLYAKATAFTSLTSASLVSETDTNITFSVAGAGATAQNITFQKSKPSVFAEFYSNGAPNTYASLPANLATRRASSATVAFSGDNYIQINYPAVISGPRCIPQ